MGDIFEHLCAFQQGFGGYAAPIEAHTSQGFFFDHGRFHAQLRSPDRGDVASGTAAYYNDIIIHVEEIFDESAKVINLRKEFGSGDLEFGFSLHLSPY
jgi:hypothetical protein